jgi:hypothetical protein
MTIDQIKAFQAPLIGLRTERVQAWTIAPWQFGLSFNR